MKNVIINENIEQEIIDHYLTESFYPSSEKVLLIKDYLDKNFSKSQMDDIDENGYPKKINCINMLSKDKQILKVLKPSELLMVLDDKFNRIITDKKDRKKFLKQVIVDWFNGNIKNGVLTVNRI